MIPFTPKSLASICRALLLAAVVCLTSLNNSVAAPQLVGTPVQVSENRGILAIEVDGKPLIAAFALDQVEGVTRNSLLIIDPINGETEQYWYPAQEAPNEPLFHTLRASTGLIYTTIGQKLVEFDPRERRWSFEGPIDGLAMSFVEAPDGKIYFGTYSRSMLWEFNPATRHLRQVVRLDATQQYPSFLGADAHGWIYAGIGTARNDLVAVRPATGERRQFAEESDRKVGQGQVQPGEDGYIYGRIHNSATYPWTRLENGEMGPLKPAAVAFAPRENAHFNQVVDNFPSGGRIVTCDLPTRTAITIDKDGVRHEVQFDYVSNGPMMSSLTLGTDGRIYGSTNHPMHFWQHDPADGSFIDFGGIPEVGGGNFPNIAARNGMLIGPTYPHGGVYRIDPTKPWVPGTGTNSNPRRLGTYSQISRPRVSMLLQDGDTVVMTGFPAYGQVGGGMVFYNLATNSQTVLTAEQLFPGHSTIAMRQLADGTLVGGTSTAVPDGGQRTAFTSVIYLMNPVSREIIAQTNLGPDVNSLEILSNGNIIGLTQDSRLFIYNPSTRQVVLPPGSRLPGNPINPGQSLIRHANGRVFLILTDSISSVRNDGVRTELTQLPQPARAGTAIHDGKLYYASGSQVWAYDLQQVASWNNPGGGMFDHPANYTGGQPPAPEIPVEFNTVDSAYTVNLTRTETVGHFFNRGGDVTFNLGEHSLNILSALGANSFNFDGGLSGGQTIFTGGGTIENAGTANIGGGASASSRHVVLESGVVLNNAGGLNIGTKAVFPGAFTNASSMTVRDGASVTIGGTSSIHLGLGTSDNNLTLTGAGSKIYTRGNVFIGREAPGSGNSMHVEDGAWFDGNGIQLGRLTINDNQLILDGADTRVDAAFLQVGTNTSSGNILEQRGGLLRLDPSQGTNQNTYLYIATAGNQIRLLGGETRVQRDIAPNINRGYVRSVAGSKITLEGGNLIVDELRITNNTDTPVEFLHGSITALRADYNPASAPLVVGDGSSATATYRMTGGNHNFGANSGLIIESNGELRGTGTINGALAIRGAFQPDGPVTLTSTVTFGNGGRYVADLGNPAGTANFTGPVDFRSGQLSLTAADTFAPAIGAQFTLATFPTGSSGTFANAPDGQVLPAGQAFLQISYESGTALRLTVVPPPEAPGETFADWVTRHGLGEKADPLTDLAGDGIPNLIKYALGLDPRKPATLPSATFTEMDGQQYLTLAIDRDPNAVDISLYLEVATVLGAWKAGDEEIEIVVNEPARIVFRDTLPVSSHDRRFLRLRVSTR